MPQPRQPVIRNSLTESISRITANIARSHGVDARSRCAPPGRCLRSSPRSDLRSACTDRLAREHSSAPVRVARRSMHPKPLSRPIHSKGHTTLAAAVKAAGLVDTPPGARAVHPVRADPPGIRKAAEGRRAEGARALQQASLDQDADLSRGRCRAGWRRSTMSVRSSGSTGPALDTDIGSVIDQCCRRRVLTRR